MTKVTPLHETAIPFLDRYVMLLKINKKLPLSVISVLLYERQRIFNAFSKLELWSMALFKNLKYSFQAKYSKVLHLIFTHSFWNQPSFPLRVSFCSKLISLCTLCTVWILFSQEYLKILLLVLLLKEFNSWYWPGYGQILQLRVWTAITSLQGSLVICIQSLRHVYSL